LTFRSKVAAVAIAFCWSLAVCSVAQADRGVVGQFGEAGSGDGQISYGAGVDVYGATGDVYVSDAFNGRIVRFDSQGNFISAFGWGVADGAEEFEICTSACQAGTGGSGAGQFAGPEAGPRHLAIDQADGSLYVLDPGNYRIEKFDSEGNFELAIGWGVADGAAEPQTCTAACQAGVSGNGAGQLNDGMWEAGLAVDPTSGHLLFTDFLNSRVQELTSSGDFARMFGRDVEEGGGEGFEICTEAAKCKPGAPGSELGEFGEYQPRQLAIDSTGAIYAMEVFPTRIQKFTPSGGGLTPSLFAPDVDFEAGVAAMTVDRSTDHLVVVNNQNGSYFDRAQEIDQGGNVVDRYLGGLETYSVTAIAFDPVSGRGYVTADEHSVYVVDEMTAPEATVEPASEVTATGATLNGTVNSQGEPPAHYHFEYSLEGSGAWVSTADATVPGDSADHHVSAAANPPVGLEPNSTYLVRLVVEKPLNEPIVSAEISFHTGSAAPIVQTVGSPYRTATSAELSARVNARGSDTTYRFEYGTSSSYGSSVPAAGEADAGSGLRSVLVTQQVSDLQPDTTYHYRVVATNAGGTTAGTDMTVTTRPSDQPLTHGHFPGPPASDRAWEQVNLDDTGGNPVFAAFAFSDAGDRAVYQLTGGTPQSDNGTMMNQFYAERTPSGWETSSIWPTRAESTGSAWHEPAATHDLSKLMAENITPGASEWLLAPGSEPQKLIDIPEQNRSFFYAVSEDLSRVLVRMKGTVDPDIPLSEENNELYDVTSGTARLVSYLPDGSIPSCGVPRDGSSVNLPNNVARPQSHWVAADGSQVIFPSQGNTTECEMADRQLYLRDLEAEETVEISGPALSGQECSAAFVRATDDAAFFWSQSRLTAEDNEPDPSTCGTFAPNNNDGDVFRYDFASGDVTCLTCPFGKLEVVPGASNFGASGGIAVAADGSRVYFTSPRRLVVGEGAEGASNVYRLDTRTGELAFVSPAGKVGDLAVEGEALNADASVLVFTASDPRMNAYTGSDNRETPQYYRYDDRDGSLVCVSCPRDGSSAGQVPEHLVMQEQIGPNTTPVDEKGDFVFITSAPLVAADQNTAGPDENPQTGNDVYEWRDGRLLLVSDGQTTWAGRGFISGVGISGVSPSGHDIFFTASAQLTPDALDGFRRLYDARVGGGFEFPQQPPPCPLETCQGEAQGAPGTPTPASPGFHGAGNLKPRAHPHRRCRKHHGKKRRCVRKHHAKKKQTHKNGRAH
jgi:hypothetical protein